MKKAKLIAFLFILIIAARPDDARAQVKLEDVIGNVNLNDILGSAKFLKVNKGFSPIFSIGNFQINKVGILGEKLKGIGILGDILGKKNIDHVMKLYGTYKTGLVIYKLLASAGTVVGATSVIKGLTADSKFDSKTVKMMLYPALASLVSGVVTKVVTKAASYKAVDMFNGVARKTLKDILSVRPASQNFGLGLYVQL